MAILLLERDDDLNPVIVHSNTYGGLVHDIFRIDNNKIEVMLEKGSVTYDLSPITD